MCSRLREADEGDWGEEGYGGGGDLNVNCEARLVSTGSLDAPPALIVLYLLLCLALFFAFPARVLLVIPLVSPHNNTATPMVLGCLLGVAALCTYALAAFTDPGVILPKTITPSTTQTVMPRPPRIQRILTSRGRVPLTYCEECHIYRGKRTEHCPQSNNCIHRLDHFCPWLGNDVGYRNYAYFFWFIASVCLLECLVVGSCVAQLVLAPSSAATTTSSSEFIGTVSLLCLVGLSSVVSFPLCLMHCKLAGEGRTTQEMLIPRVRRGNCSSSSIVWRVSTLFNTVCWRPRRGKGESLVRRRVKLQAGAVEMAKSVTAEEFLALTRRHRRRSVKEQQLEVV